MLTALTTRSAKLTPLGKSLEQVLENVEGRGPGPDGDACPGFYKSFGDGKAETRVVSHAGDERALAGKVDVEHLSDIAANYPIYKG